MNRKYLIALLLIFLFAATSAQAAGQLVVAAASDLQFAMPKIARNFERETGTTVKLSFGSSGNFANQIQNGAPYDVFFSADMGYPQRLQEEGLADPGSLYEYAKGALVLWVPASSRLDLKQGLAVLLSPQAQKIAIANPAHAPYGRAAVAAFQKAGIYEKIRSKLVMGENISQAAQFVESGSASAGILALSLAVAPAMQAKGRYIEVPAGDYPPLAQACMVLKSSQHKELARKFVQFMQKPETLSILARYGFSQPR